MKIQLKIYQLMIPTTQQPNDADVPKTLKNGHVILDQKINKNRPNILLKTTLKTIVQLGSILEPTWVYFGRFWVPSWSQVGTKI